MVVGIVAAIYGVGFVGTFFAPYFVVRNARPVNYRHPDVDDVRDIPLDTEAVPIEEAAKFQEDPTPIPGMGGPDVTQGHASFPVVPWDELEM